MNTDRFTLSVDEYLAKKNVLFYLEDAVNQLLDHREEYVQFGIVRYFAEYFSSVRTGNHVLFREFSYVKATAHNRASFIRLFWRSFRQIGKNGDLLAMMDYSSLLQLLCPDFPVEVVQKAARIVLMDDAMDCPMSFADFIYAFQIQFYFEGSREQSRREYLRDLGDMGRFGAFMTAIAGADRAVKRIFSAGRVLVFGEFLESVAMIYQDLLSGKSPNTVIVPTSSSVEQHPHLADDGTAALEGVEALLFCSYIEALCERFKHNHPSAGDIREVLQNTQRVSFYGFLMALVKHEGISQDIGSLPNKADLLVDPAMDKELEKLIAQVSLSPAPHSSSSGAGQKDPPRKASPRKSLHQRKRIEMESDGSTEETDSSEN